MLRARFRTLLGVLRERPPTCDGVTVGIGGAGRSSAALSSGRCRRCPIAWRKCRLGSSCRARVAGTRTPTSRRAAFPIPATIPIRHDLGKPRPGRGTAIAPEDSSSRDDSPRTLVFPQQLRSFLGVPLGEILEILLRDLPLGLFELLVRPPAFGRYSRSPRVIGRSRPAVVGHADAGPVGHVSPRARQSLEVLLELIRRGISPGDRSSSCPDPRPERPVRWQRCTARTGCCKARTDRDRIPAGRGRSSRPPAPRRGSPPRPRNRASPRDAISFSASRTILDQYANRPETNRLRFDLRLQSEILDSRFPREGLSRSSRSRSWLPRLGWIDWRDWRSANPEILYCQSTIIIIEIGRDHWSIPRDSLAATDRLPREPDMPVARRS